MGDSDEEYDRRRRDKFRRERSDYQERGREERGRRDDWSERDGRGSRREYRDYDPRNRRDRYSPARQISPPMKRMRRDWDDRGGSYGNNFDGGYPGGGGGGGGGMMGGMHSGWGMPGQMPQRDLEPGLTQPPMMTFKQFLSSQDDGIDDQEAVKKYNEYKLEFKRQQINEFFLNHKDEEWFKLKHHPEESVKRKSELQAALKRRLAVFMELYEKGWVDSVALDQENSEQIIKFLDAVVIKLEGGTDFDLKVLDKPYEEEKPKESAPYLSPGRKNSKDDTKEEEEEEKVEEVVPSKKKRKRSHGSRSGEENEESSDSESEEESVPPVPEENEVRVTENGESKEKETRERSQSPSDKEGSVDKEDSLDKSDVVEKVDMEDSLQEKEPSVKEGSVEREGCEEVEKTQEETIEDKDEPKPRALHKTHSIFLRYLAPSITKQEVEALCKRYSGFLRVAIADPQPERRFVRRAWVTFERSVNIKEMCWNLNGVRLRDSELGAIVNRDLSRRIRSVNGISSHKQVVRADIKLAARIIQNLDRMKKLWDEEEKEEEMDQRGFLVTSKNPLLKNITDYLIEEASAEEDELLGMGDNDEGKEGGEGCALERDESLIKVLDRLLLYLRVVHSVDYYNSSEYPSEDEMPNRCGIMHARGSPPSSKVTQQEINDYISHFEMKSQPFLQSPSKLDEEECVKLGKKDPDIEVEKFIQANTQELAKDKWQITNPVRAISPKFSISTSFLRLVKSDTYIDKTKLVMEFIDNKYDKATAENAVYLITCPRRFGKSMNMQMIKYCLGIELDANNEILPFVKTKVYEILMDENKKEYKTISIVEEYQFCTQHLTKYPIIFIDCKNAKGRTFDLVLKMYRKQLRLTFKQHEYLLKIWKMNKSNESDDDIEERTQQFKKYIGFKQLEENVLIDGLKLLSEWLYEYFCKQKHSSEGVVILMDEYDAPINFAVNSNLVTNEDVEKIHLFFDQVYSATFKENDFLFRGLITGISGIVRASAGSEFNSALHCKFLDKANHFQQYYGLSVQEVEFILKRIDLSADKEFQSQLKKYYNGYYYNNRSLYNVWSVILECRNIYLQNKKKIGDIDEDIENNDSVLTSHWIKSGYFKCLDHIFTIPKIRKIIESLIAKEQYTFTFTASLTIQNLYDLKKLISSNINDNSIDLFFSYIFELGYLSSTAKDCYIIPNEEIRQDFIKKLLRYFENKYHIKEELTYATEMFNELINIQNQKLTNKQQEDFLSALNALFQKMYFADINDVDVGNHPNEDIFHSLLNCIIIQSLKIYKFGTEVVSKNILERGRADIVFITNDGIGGIIEVKYSNNGHDVLQQSVSNAFEQIEKKNYEFIFQNHINQGVKYGILKVGIGFSINIKQHTNAKHKPEPKVGMDCYYYPIINSDNDEMICDNTSESS